MRVGRWCHRGMGVEERWLLSGDDGWIVLVFACWLVGGFFFALCPAHDIEKRPHSNNHFLHQWDILNMLGWVWYLKVVCCATYMKDGEWRKGGGWGGCREQGSLDVQTLIQMFLQCALYFVPRRWFWRIFYWLSVLSLVWKKLKDCRSFCLRAAAAATAAPTVSLSAWSKGDGAQVHGRHLLWIIIKCFF